MKVKLGKRPIVRGSVFLTENPNQGCGSGSRYLAGSGPLQISVPDPVFEQALNSTRFMKKLESKYFFFVNCRSDPDPVNFYPDAQPCAPESPQIC